MVGAHGPKILDFKVSRMLENAFTRRFLIKFGCDETTIIGFQYLLFLFKQSGTKITKITNLVSIYIISFMRSNKISISFKVRVYLIDQNTSIKTKKNIIFSIVWFLKSRLNDTFF